MFFALALAQEFVIHLKAVAMSVVDLLSSKLNNLPSSPVGHAPEDSCCYTLDFYTAGNFLEQVLGFVFQRRHSLSPHLLTQKSWSLSTLQGAHRWPGKRRDGPSSGSSDCMWQSRPRAGCPELGHQAGRQMFALGWAERFS